MFTFGANERQNGYPRPHSEQVEGLGERGPTSSQKLLDFLRITVLLLSEVDRVPRKVILPSPHCIFLACEFDRGSMSRMAPALGHCSLTLFWIFFVGVCVGMCDMCMSTFCAPQCKCTGQEATWGVIPPFSPRSQVIKLGSSDLGCKSLYLTQPFQWPANLNSTEFFWYCR